LKDGFRCQQGGGKKHAEVYAALGRADKKKEEGKDVPITPRTGLTLGAEGKVREKRSKRGEKGKPKRQKKPAGYSGMSKSQKETRILNGWGVQK